MWIPLFSRYIYFINIDVFREQAVNVCGTSDVSRRNHRYQLRMSSNYRTTLKKFADRVLGVRCRKWQAIIANVVVPWCWRWSQGIWRSPQNCCCKLQWEALRFSTLRSILRSLTDPSCRTLNRLRAIVSPSLCVTEGPRNCKTVAVSRIGTRLD